MQKHGLTPDQKLRKALYDPLEKRSSDEKVVTLIGNDFALDETCDIKRLLRSGGYTLKELTACTNWEEYQELGSGKMLISCYPPAKYGAEMLAERLQRTHLYLPGSFDYEEIKEEIRTFAEAVKNSVSNVEKNDKGAILRNTENSMSFEDLEAFFQQEIVLCEDALKHAKSIIGRTPIALDYLYHPRPLGLAKLLLTHDFNVTTIYLDSISEEEKEALDRKQQYLISMMEEQPRVTITYFVPDAKKTGGSYVTKCGNLKKLNPLERWIQLTDGTKIALDDIAKIESDMFKGIF